MKCPECGNKKDKVLDSRTGNDGSFTRRRRKCLVCGYRYTTYERVEESTPLMVIKRRSNIREEFQPDKLRKSVETVCYKLDIPAHEVEDTIEEIIQHITQNYHSEIPWNKISELVMDRLEKLNKIAYIRYGSAYKVFENLEYLLEDILSLVPVADSEQPNQEDLSSLNKKTLPKKNPKQEEPLDMRMKEDTKSLATPKTRKRKTKAVATGKHGKSENP